MEINELKLIIADQAVEIRGLKQDTEQKGEAVMYWFGKYRELEAQVKKEKETGANANENSSINS